MTIQKFRSKLYKLAKFLGDAQAVTSKRKGSISRRIQRRVLGKFFGKFIGRIVK